MAASVQNNTNNRFLTGIYSPESQRLGNQKITLKENHDWKTDIDGKAKEYHSLGQTILRVLGSSEGLFRFGQLVERAPKFANAVRVELGMEKSPVLDDLSNKALGGWIWCTTFPRTIEVTSTILESIKDSCTAVKEQALSTDQIVYKVEKTLTDLTEATSMWGNSISMTAALFPNGGAVAKTFRATAEAATFGHDVASLHMNSQNFLRAHSVDVKGATPDMEATIAETKKYNLIAIAKDICALASGALGLYFLATGIAVVSGLALATLALGSTSLAVIRKLYGETMMFRPITFLDSRQVTQITA